MNRSYRKARIQEEALLRASPPGVIPPRNQDNPAHYRPVDTSTPDGGSWPPPRFNPHVLTE